MPLSSLSSATFDDTVSTNQNNCFHFNILYSSYVIFCFASIIILFNMAHENAYGFVWFALFCCGWDVTYWQIHWQSYFHLCYSEGCVSKYQAIIKHYVLWTVFIIPWKCLIHMFMIFAFSYKKDTWIISYVFSTLQWTCQLIYSRYCFLALASEIILKILFWRVTTLCKFVL